MKKPTILFSMIMIMLFIAFQGFKSIEKKVHYVNYHESQFFKSAGLANKDGSDATGGPLSNGDTCSLCHSPGGVYVPTIQINLLDGINPVTSYVPGQNYTVQLVVSATSGSPAGYGVQGVALDGSDAQAGTFNSFTTANSQIVNLSGIQYIEQNGRSVSGVFEFDWTAPTSGTGNVNIYAIGLAVNGSGTSGDNEVTTSKTFTESALGVEESTFKNKLTLYPNPTVSDVNIELGSFYDKIDLTVFDVLGQVVLTKTERNIETVSFEIKAKQGIYFAKLYSDTGEQASIPFVID